MEEKHKELAGAELIDVKQVYAGWTKLYLARVRWPDGKQNPREIEDHGSGVAVLPYDPERRTAVLVRQFRPPAAFLNLPPELLEAVAGVIDSGTPEEAGRREAMEEVGLRLGRLDPVAETWMMPGISTERMHYFLAEYRPADRVERGGGLAAEGEHIIVEEMALSDLLAHAEGKGPVDGKLVILLQALRLRRPELFVP